MSKSIIQKDTSRCFLCGGTVGLEEHHIFGGANRKWSEKYGLKVVLCGIKCHREGKDSAHKNRKTADSLKRLGQIAFEAKHGDREKFMSIFGKNYL